MQDLGPHAWMVHGVGHVFVLLVFLCTIAAVLSFSCSFFALSLGRRPLYTFLTCRSCLFYRFGHFLPFSLSVFLPFDRPVCLEKAVRGGPDCRPPGVTAGGFVLA